MMVLTCSKCTAGREVLEPCFYYIDLNVTDVIHQDMFGNPDFCAARKQGAEMVVGPFSLRAGMLLMSCMMLCR